ncbi:SigE family RNA polymerase sigma factor [Micromonospora sp. CPCC 206061]|uniref:SigE family RNA polymerase sigma factor n=1 Tax=Micromonospora sp. CPCC 206061 TaxID=3122410 RepID=UPI003FA60818
MATNGSALSKFAYLLVGNHADAEDLLQNALTKTAVHWRRVARYDNPAAYVRQAMVNETYGRWRRKRLLQMVSVTKVPERQTPDALRASDDRVDVWRALDRLAPRQRAVLILRFHEDLSVEETAALLRCSTGTVKSQTHAALSRLRALAPELADLRVS